MDGSGVVAAEDGGEMVEGATIDESQGRNVGKELTEGR